jgi:hypothetical protein
MGICSEGTLTAYYHGASLARKEQARMRDERLLNVQRGGRRNPHKLGRYGVNPELFYGCAFVLHDKDRAQPQLPQEREDWAALWRVIGYYLGQ